MKALLRIDTLSNFTRLPRPKQVYFHVLSHQAAVRPSTTKHLSSELQHFKRAASQSAFTITTAASPSKMSQNQAPTWLITGTSNGLGLSLSQYILSQGHNLISISRHKIPHPSLQSIIDKQIQATSPSPALHHIPFDLSNQTPTAIPSTISTFLTEHPDITIDILVNNAAITLFDAVEQTSAQDLHTVMTTNFFSPVYLIQSLLPHMRERTKHKHEHEDNDNDGEISMHHPKVIVNISSTQGLCTDPSEMAYDASKHALEAMSGVLAAEVADFDIRVMVVELGSLRTGFASAGEKARQNTQNSDPNPNRHEADNEENQKDANNPYSDPSHPVAKRKAGVAKLASVPGLAKGDPGKTAKIIFDAVTRTEGSLVDRVLESQRRRTLEDGGNGRVERLVLGSDAQPKIERVVERLRFDVESCREVSGIVEADG